ncbi:MAG: efflux RND transporter periplasmic adaptor subunit [Mucinivorans sp.]
MNTIKKSGLYLALVALVACGSEPKQVATAEKDTTSNAVSGATPKADSGAMSEAKTMQTDAVSSATAVANITTLNGTLVTPPQNYATVTLTIAGTVHSTNIMPGTYVKRSDVIVTLENPEFITLQQTFLDNHAQVEFLSKEYDRQKLLAQQEAASEKKMQQSRADYLSAKSRQDAAAAQLALLGVSTQMLLADGIIPFLKIKAPISGYVSKAQLNMGKHVAAGETLCEIVDKSNMMICLTAYEKNIGKIKVGDLVEFRVTGLGEKTYQASVSSVGQQVDRQNRSIEVYARVQNSDPQFRPGMYIAARIVKK